MADEGSIAIGVNLNDKQAQRELARLERKIVSLQDKLTRAETERAPIDVQAQNLAARLDAATEKLRQMEAAGTSGNDLAEQKDLVRSLAAGYKQIDQILVRYDNTIKKINADIAWESNKAGELAARLAGVESAGEAAAEEVADVGEEAESTGEELDDMGDAGEEAGETVSEAMQRAADRLDRLGKRVGGIVKKIVGVSLAAKALSGIRKWLGEVISTDDQAAAAIGRLKGALLTLAQPLLQVVIPAVAALANMFARVVTAAASFVSMLFGTTIEQSEKAAESLNAERDAINGVGGAAKSAAKSLAAFDTLNKVGDKDSGGNGGSIAPTFTASNDFKPPEWLRDIDFTKLQESLVVLKDGFSELAGVVSDAFGWAWENILVPFGKWAIEEALPVVITALGEAFSLLAAVARRLWPIIKPLWEKVLKPLGKWAGELVLKGLEELVDLLGDLTDLINGDISFGEFISGLSGIQVAILGLAGFKVLGALATFAAKFKALPNAVGQIIPGVKLKLAGLAKTVGLGALAVVDAYLIAYDVEKITEAKTAYDEAAETYERSIATALDNYKYLYETKGKDVADEWAMMVYQIDLSGQDFETAQQTLADHVATLWGDAPKNWKEALVKGWNDYFGENGEGILVLLDDAFSALGKWLREKLGIEGGLLAKLGIVNTGTTTNALGGSSLSGKIPGIATGTVTPASRNFSAAAFVGDTGNSETVAEAVMQVGNKILEAVQNQEIATYLDGELVSQQLYSPMQVAAKRRGSNLIQGGATR